MNLKLNAEHYHTHSSTQTNLAIELIERFGIKRLDRILDIGCGDGKLSALLASQAVSGSVIGVDPSSDMVSYAARYYPQSDYDNLLFQLGAAEDPHGENEYTLITAFSCLHWVRDLPRAFHSFYQALKPTGRFIAVTYPKGSLYFNVFRDAFLLPQWKNHFEHNATEYWLTAEDYRQLAERTGFQVEAFDFVESTAHYPDQQTFKDFVNGWLPCLVINQTIPSQFLDDVTALAWERYGNADGSADIMFSHLGFLLIKP